MRDIQTLSDAIIGTCRSVEEGMLEVFGDDTDTDLSVSEAQELDGLCFECAQCGWWCEIGEAVEGDNGDVCQDCHSDA